MFEAFPKAKGMGGGAAGGGWCFPSTHWTQVFLSGDLEREAGRAALDQLLGRYLGPLKGHLVAGFRASPEQAEDWVQGFVERKVLEREMLRTASAERGRFRTFLLNALDHYVLDQIDREGRKKRLPPGGFVPLEVLEERERGRRMEDGGSRMGGQAAADAAPGAAFDVAWARAVVEEAIKVLREELGGGRMDTQLGSGDGTGSGSAGVLPASGKNVGQVAGKMPALPVGARGAQWRAFEVGFLGPVLEGTEKPSGAELAAACGLQSAGQAYDALRRGKEKFEQALRGVIREYAGTEREIDEEIRELIAILSEN